MKLLKLFAATILAGLSVPALAQNTEAVQSALELLGYDPGPVDGMWGGQTRIALEEFHADNGGAFSGRLTQDDHAALHDALQTHIAKSRTPLDAQKLYYRYDFHPDVEIWFPSQYAFTDGADRAGNSAFPFAILQPFVHDFDGDSCDDVLVQFMDSNAHPYLIRGNADARTEGLVAELADYIPKTRAIRNAAIRDIDGDGKADFVGFTAPHGLDGRNYVPRAEQEIIIPASGDAWLTTQSTYAHGGLIGDVNGDGIADIFPISERPSGRRTALLGDGNGNYSELFEVTALSDDFIFSARSADLNGDGVDDFVAIIGRDYTSSRRITPAVASENGTLAIAMGEAGKSINDLEFIRMGAHIMDETQWLAFNLLAGYSMGADAGYGSSGTYAAPSNVDLVDFDSDGDLDVLVGYFVSLNSSWKTSGFRLFRNDSGSFSDVTEDMAPHQPANLFPGNQQPDEIQNQPTDALMGANMTDMNGDGVKDLLLAVQTPDVMHHQDYRATIYVNVDGVFQPTVSDDDAFRYTGHMAVGDFNCDGADDIAGAGFHEERRHSIRIIFGKR